MPATAPNFELIQSPNDISRHLEADAWRMDVLKAAEALNLPDWWIGAGFLRSFVWDIVEGREPEQNSDVDLVYFDPDNFQPGEDHWRTDLDLTDKMQHDYPFAEWEIRNQARMHYINDFKPYTSTADGIAHWVETATCVGVKLEDGELKYLFCYGTDDLFGLIARPIPDFQTPELITTFRKRIADKHWQARWPHLTVIET